MHVCRLYYIILYMQKYESYIYDFRFACSF
jgi:hypothetical protein